MSGAATQRDQWTFGIRVLANQIDRARVRTTLMYHALPRFSLGIEFNPLSQDVGPLANWTALTETEHRPALIFGTSSDRIGTPHGQSFYGTLSKNLEPYIGLPISPYAGVAWGSYEDEFRPLAGGNIGLWKGLSASLIYDGVHAHPMLNYTHDNHTFSFILVEGKDPGISYSISF